MKQLLASLLVCGACMSALTAHAQAPNSAKDPFVLKPGERPSASLITPFGFSVSARPFYGSDAVPMNYGGDLFYDAWSIGYHVTNYGNAIRLGLRSLGREDADGWFFEYGSGTHAFDTTIHYDNGWSDSTIHRKQDYNFVGLGIGYIAGYHGKGVTTGFGLTAAVGTAISDGGGFYIEPTVSYGVRIPISTMALTIEAQGFGGLINIPSGKDYVTGEGGIGLNFKYGFNFND